MSKNKKNNGVYLVALVLFLGGLGYMVFSAISSESVYFLNVSEALAMKPADLKSARLFGKVSGNNLKRRADHMGVDFVIKDKVNPGDTIEINYQGVVPDTFKPGVEVIVEGAMAHDRHVFKATSLITKCPSKYEKISQDMDAGNAG